ncbi:MAG: class I SAM-dependent methyltransferase [Caulobacteraceae bacterium]
MPLQDPDNPQFAGDAVPPGAGGADRGADRGPRRPERGAVRIVDLGGEPDYWRRLFDRATLERCGVHVVLVNPQAFDVDDPMFEAVVGDACALPQYADGAFDLVHSNSVVEHVGDWVRMEAFAGEVRRLAAPLLRADALLLFPIEPHFSAPFFHWRSEQARARALMRRGHGFSTRAPRHRRGHARRPARAAARQGRSSASCSPTPATSTRRPPASPSP